MDRCNVCGNAYEKAFRVTFADESTYVFDSFECAIQALAPRCHHCACRIIGHGIERGEAMFCCEHCARQSLGDVDEAGSGGFRENGPPVWALPERRREEGRVGWVVLWLLGVPIPVLVLLYLMRGCT
jgi:hypothetical protein